MHRRDFFASAVAGSAALLVSQSLVACPQVLLEAAPALFDAVLVVRPAVTRLDPETRVFVEFPQPPMRCSFYADEMFYHG